MLRTFECLCLTCKLRCFAVLYFNFAQTQVPQNWGNGGSQIKVLRMFGNLITRITMFFSLKWLNCVVNICFAVSNTRYVLMSAAPE